MRLEDIEKEWHVVRCSYNEDDDKITWVETYVDKLLAVAKAAKKTCDDDQEYMPAFNELKKALDKLEKDNET